MPNPEQGHQDRFSIYEDNVRQLNKLLHWHRVNPNDVSNESIEAQRNRLEGMAEIIGLSCEQRQQYGELVSHEQRIADSRNLKKLS